MKPTKTIKPITPKDFYPELTTIVTSNSAILATLLDPATVNELTEVPNQYELTVTQDQLWALIQQARNAGIDINFSF